MAPESIRGEPKRVVANSINDLSKIYDIKDNDIVFGSLALHHHNSKTMGGANGVKKPLVRRSLQQMN